MAQTCVQHPTVPATFICDGCQKTLCGECVEESHVLLLCRLCGERALPLYAGQPASVTELRKQQARTAPYSLAQALTYPFRGSSLFMFIATLIAWAFVWLIGVFGSMTLIFGCLALVLQLGFLGMVVGLQFKIVRTTAEGENELPDWPEYTDVWRLIQDLLTWLVIHVVMIVAVVWFLVLGLLGGGLTFEPRLDFWLGFALVAWLAVAFMVMAYGAVGTYRRLKVFEIHNHVKGYLAAGADALKITNLVFGLGALALLLQAFLEGAVPYVGNALSGTIGVYWVFVLPHLAGLLFRRHSEVMERLYWPGMV